VRLDYSDAEVSVEVLGIPTPASVVDENGDSLGVVDLELQLEDTNHIVVASGTPALLQLDFDLAATHVVNPLTNARYGNPGSVLVATIVPLDSREFRLRGRSSRWTRRPAATSRTSVPSTTRRRRTASSRC
jgi:hypothetical protein